MVSRKQKTARVKVRKTKKIRKTRKVKGHRATYHHHYWHRR